MQFADFNMVASIGGFGFGLMQVYFFVFVVWPAMRGRGEKAPQKPWEAAEGLEWKCHRLRHSIPSRTLPSSMKPQPV